MFTMDEDTPNDRNTKNNWNSKVNIRWSAGSCSEKGVRSVNEDRVVLVHDMTEDEEGGGEFRASWNEHCVKNKLQDVKTASAYFAVYDGHCGSHASSYLEHRLHKNIYR